MAARTEAIFGLRIRRASDLIGEQGREAFWRIGIDLDAKLISLVFALHEGGSMSSSELAGVTGLSRQLVESRLKTLENGGYVSSRISDVDARRREFSLTRRKAKEIEQAVATMVDFEKVYEELWAEIGVDVGASLLELEKAIRARPLLARLCEKFPRYSGKVRVGHETS